MVNKITIITERKVLIKYFILFAFVNTLLLYYIHDILVTDPSYFTGGNANSVTLYRRIWRFIYFISPLYELIKMLIISFFLHKASELLKLGKKNFAGVFFIVLFSQMLLLIPDFIKFFWFTFIDVNYSMKDFHYFSPFSLFYFFESIDTTQFLFNVLKDINLFNLAYWFVIVILIRTYYEIKIDISIRVVALLYGSLCIVISILRYFVLFKLS